MDAIAEDAAPPPPRMYAMKVMEKAFLLNKDAVEEVMNEVAILQAFQHPFIARLYCSFQVGMVLLSAPMHGSALCFCFVWFLFFICLFNNAFVCLCYFMYLFV